MNGCGKFRRGYGFACSRAMDIAKVVYNAWVAGLPRDICSPAGCWKREVCCNYGSADAQVGFRVFNCFCGGGTLSINVVNLRRGAGGLGCFFTVDEEAVKAKAKEMSRFMPGFFLEIVSEFRR